MAAGWLLKRGDMVLGTLGGLLAVFPSDESLGYSQSSLRDWTGVLNEPEKPHPDNGYRSYGGSLHA